jgi:hypothetical protein
LEKAQEWGVCSKSMTPGLQKFVDAKTLRDDADDADEAVA